MVATLETFDSDQIDPRGMYILASNFYSKPSVTLGQDRTGNLTPTADNYHSGISEADFYVVMEEFADRHGQDVIYEDDETVIMTGTQEALHCLQAECGDRFSYDIGSANMVHRFIAHERSEREEMAMMGYQEEDDLYDAPHLDS